MLKESVDGTHKNEDIIPLQEQTPQTEENVIAPDTEETGDGPTGVSCTGCGVALAGGHFLLNGTPWCPTCKEEMQHQTRFTFRKLLKSCLAGYVGAIVAGGLWALVTIVTGYQLGLIAIFVGLIVGHAVRWGARPATGRRFQILALALTVLGLSYSTIPMLVKEFKDNPDYLEDLKKGWKKAGEAEAQVVSEEKGTSTTEAPAETASAVPGTAGTDAQAEVPAAPLEKPAAVAEGSDRAEDAGPASVGDHDDGMNPILGLLLGIALMAAGLFLAVFVAPLGIYVLCLFGDPFSFIFLAIALWEAWRINTPVRLEFEGPVQGDGEMDFSKAQYEAP